MQVYFSCFENAKVMREMKLKDWIHRLTTNRTLFGINLAERIFFKQSVTLCFSELWNIHGRFVGITAYRWSISAPRRPGKYMYEIISFRYRSYKRIPSFTWKYLIETTCIIKKADGGPYVADFTVFFPKVWISCWARLKVNQKIVLIHKEAKMACPSCCFL